MSLSVELRGVTKTYGPVRALVGVNARFEGGRVSVIEGANGSGKSTLLSILGTLARPTLGEVDHGALGKTNAEVRAVLGWVGHETLAYGDLSGRENVMLAAKLRGIEAERGWREACERFDLASFGDRPIRTYSRGQRQRIAVAKALVHAPSLVLLDEPTAGLDARSTERLERVVREEAKRGAVVILVTHDPAFARVGDVHVRLERGRVVS
ncbi:ABC transporter ATP-binding protein [Pendulispora albinea]|uniref:ABC transporter ATP-binding protein n=1 Tax=Pendulispora albinea TaxID=2741071 RepID=A0ABZ2LUR2_9BACT